MIICCCKTSLVHRSALSDSPALSQCCFPLACSLTRLHVVRTPACLAPLAPHLGSALSAARACSASLHPNLRGVLSKPWSESHCPSPWALARVPCSASGISADPCPSRDHPPGRRRRVCQTPKPGRSAATRTPHARLPRIALPSGRARASPASEPRSQCCVQSLFVVHKAGLAGGAPRRLLAGVGEGNREHDAAGRPRRSGPGRGELEGGVGLTGMHLCPRRPALLSVPPFADSERSRCPSREQKRALKSILSGGLSFLAPINSAYRLSSTRISTPIQPF